MEKIDLNDHKNEDSNADIICTLKDRISQDKHKLKELISKMLNMDTQLSEVFSITDKILKIIPDIRKNHSMMRLESAIIKHPNITKRKDVDPDVFKSVVVKMKKDITEKGGKLDYDIYRSIIRKLSSKNDSESDIFTRFREILPETSNIDEIETVVKIVKAKIAEDSSSKELLPKDEVLKSFLYDAGFNSDPVYYNMIMSDNLASIHSKSQVTEAKLSKVLKALNLEVHKADKAFEKQVDSLGKIIDSDVPVYIRIFSNYIANPFSAAFGVIGTAILILYTVSNYGLNYLSGKFPLINELYYATSLPIIDELLDPSSVFITGFLFILISGFIKMLDERLKHKVIYRQWTDSEK